MRTNTIARLLGCSMLVTLTATAAHAQQAATTSAPTVSADGAAPAQATTEPVPSSDPSPDEIVVTAQRRSESLQRVPISVTVASGANLEAQAIRSLEDFSVRQSNVRIAQAPASDQIHVRGTGSGFGNGFEQSVATFVDGLYRNRSRSSRVALFDVDRVEILKGPQTTFFGANAIAGALNIATRRPTDRLEANGIALYAPTDGEYNVEAGVGGPLSDTLKVRLAGRWSGMDGYIDSTTGLDNGPHLNDKQGRISAIWNPVDRLEIFARFDIARLRDRNTFLSELLNCPPNGLPAGNLCARAIALSGGLDDRLDQRSGTLQGGFSNLNMEEGMTTATLDLDAVTLVSTTGFLHQRSNTYSNFAPYPVPSPLNTPGYLGIVFAENFRQFSQELRLQSSGSGPFSYMVGGYYEKGDLDLPILLSYYFARFGGAAAPTYNPNSLIALNGFTKQKSTTWSGFGTASYEFTDKLTASAGLRYTNVRKTAARNFVYGLGPVDGQRDGFVAGPASVQIPLSNAIGNSVAPFPQGVRRDDKLMPSANVRYQATPTVMLYGSYTKGFKAGGFSGQTPDVFAPETVDAYEVGAKTSFADRMVTLNLALYRNDFSNLQESQSTVSATGVPITVVGNSAASRAQGVEANVTLRPVQDLSFGVDLAYTDSFYRSYPNAPCSPLEAVGNPVCVRDRSGQRRAYAPEWSGSVSADYRAAVSDRLEARLGALMYFSSAYFQQSVTSSIVEQPGYAKFDARVAIGPDDRRWEVALIGKNLTDRTTASYRNYAPGAPGSVYAVADRPRSVAVQASFKY